MNNFENRTAQERADEPLYLDAEYREMPDRSSLRYKLETVALFTAIAVIAVVFGR